jgi:transketolase
MRCFEQIRINLCYQNLPVKLIGIGGGFSYGTLGVTHQAIEDIAIMRALPGMTIMAPASKYEMEQLAPQINLLSGPAYIRISNTDESFAYPTKTQIVLGKAAEIIDGEEVLLLATSNMVDHAHKICTQLLNHGINAGIASIHTIKPFDHEYLLSKQKKLKAVFTIEEHNIIGGLGEATSRIICEQFQQKIIFKAFGVQDFYPHEIGSRKYLQEKAGLSVESIYAVIMQKLMGTSLFAWPYNKAIQIKST